MTNSATATNNEMCTTQSRILYVDVPFENEVGGDKNRSRFLFNTLKEHFDVDLVLITKTSCLSSLWKDHKPIAVLAPHTPHFPRPSEIPAFLRADLERFTALLRRGRYAAVIARFYTGWELCELTERIYPQCAVVIDVDMLSSRLVGFSWARNPSFRRRWFLVHKWKLRRFERILFRRPWLFLFSNAIELSIAQAQAPPRNQNSFLELPNTMPRVSGCAASKREPVILFFGSMDSAANTDGFAFLVESIVPKLAPQLRRHAVSMNVVGRDPPAYFQDRLHRAGIDQINIVGRVPSMEQAIAESLFVLLPIRIASGSRTRILEAAAQRRAVVTTPLGAEGLDLGDTVLLSDSAEGLAAHCRWLLENPAQAERFGRKLQKRALARYAPELVGDRLNGHILAFVNKGNGRTI